MAALTAIEWCTHTWNPWIGCTRVSAACDHCYAATLSHRYGWAKFEAGAPRKRTSAANWKLPARYNRQAAAAGTIATVFPSLCDPFDSEVDPAWLGDMLATFEPLTSLRLLLLTKRPHLAAKIFAGRKVPDNVALGVTAEDQKMLDLRGPQILGIEARWHFLSYEPALGPIDARKVKERLAAESYQVVDALDHPDTLNRGRCRQGFDWVIAGGESGPKARPSHPDWFRSLRDQCQAADVPFFFKQWGEWAPEDVRQDLPGSDHTAVNDGKSTVYVKRFGKKAAGATLDGREWREFPQW